MGVLSRLAPRRRRVAGVVALAAAAGAAALVLTLGGGGQKAAKSNVVNVDRGDIVVTVRGVGHIGAGGGATATVGVAAGQSSPGSGGGAGRAAAAATTAAAASAHSGGAGAGVPSDAVLPATSGRVVRLLVSAGDRVAARQPIAVLNDDGNAHAAVVQAKLDLDGARLELTQRQLHDPANGAPATPGELRAAGAGVLATRQQLAAARRPATPVELGTATLELDKAQQDLQSTTSGAGPAIDSAQTALLLATQKLGELGTPNPVDVATAQLDLEKAQLDLFNLTSAASPPSQPAVDAAKLAIDVAKRKLASLTAPPSPTTVSAAQLELRKAQVELTTAKQQHGALAMVTARQAVTLARRRLAELAQRPLAAQVSVAQREFRRAEADLELLKLRGGPASATSLDLARLKVDIAQQRVALAADLERRLTVTAPTAGTVTSVTTVPGATIDPTTPIARVADLDHLTVTVDLSEFDVARAARGDQASVSVDALGGAPLKGRVTDIALAGNNNNGVVTFPVTVALGKSARLRTGMGASVRIVVAQKHGVVRVPLDAISQDKGSATVTVVEPSGATKQRDVELGLTDDSHAEVLNGLSPGDKVLGAQAGNNGP